MDDWKKILENSKIFDEYNQTISFAEMMQIIQNRSWHKRDPYYANWDEFLRINHAQEGPNNLLRARISDFCIGHGEGTWDCMVGEFS